MSDPLRIEIGKGDRGSLVWLGSGLLSDAASRLFSPSGRYFLFSSRAARAVVTDLLRATLGEKLLLDLEIDDREESKNLAAVERIADAALAAGLRRDDAFIAVGGGVVTDIVGFAAAILLRGVAWNAVPTTTGAMADAAIGGKTGVDHAQGKNLLGAFHPPRVVLIDPAALGTLPDRDYRSGLVEAFKAAWIADAELARRARLALPSLVARDDRAILDLLAGAVRVKVEIVSEDLREADRRRLLNFGHTLGHAFEAAGNYRSLRHGEAVAWGIAGALEISQRLAGLSAEDAAEIREILFRLGPFPEPARDPGSLLPFLTLDKKGSACGIAGVVLVRIGKARIEEAIPVEEWLEAARRATLC